MKPLKLTLKEFASYKHETEIDFSRFENQLFLIHGDTGAGKSTLFEAIIYVLFGADALAERDKKRFIECNLVKKPKPYVKLEFELNGKKYVAENRNGTKILKDKNGKTYKEVKNIGLRLDNAGAFKKVVIIPQGQFASFLQGKDGNREEVLKQLFQEVFNKIEIIKKKISEKKEQYEKQAEELQTLLKTYLNEEILNPESLTEALQKLQEETQILHEEIKKNKEKQEKINSEIKTLSNKQKRAETLKELLEAIEKYKKQLADLQKQEEEIRNIEQQIKKAELFSLYFKNLLERKNEEEQNLKKLQEKKLNLQEKLEEQKKRLEELEKQSAVFDKKEKELNQLQKLEKEFPEYQEKRKELEKVQKDLEKLQEEQKQLQAQEKTLLHKKDLEYVLEKQKNSGKEITEKQKKLEDINEKQKEIQALKKNNQTLQTELEKLKEEEKELRDKEEALQKIQKLFPEMKTREAEIKPLREKQKELEKLQKDIKNLSLENESLKAEIKNCENIERKIASEWEEYKQKQEELHRKLIENHIYYLVSELEEGKPCPVCGSEHHPAPAEISEVREIDDKILQKIEAEIKAKESELEEIREKKNSKIIELKTKKNSLAEKEQKLKELSELKIPEQLEKSEQEIRELRSKIKQIKSNHSLSEVSHENIETLLQQKKENEQENRQKQEKVKEDLSRNEGTIDSLKKDLQKTNSEEIKNRLETSWNELKELNSRMLKVIKEIYSLSGKEDRFPSIERKLKINKIKDIPTMLNEAENWLQKIMQKIPENLSELLETKKQEIETKQNEETRLETLIEQYEKQLQNHFVTPENLSETIKNLNQEIENYRTSKEEISKKKVQTETDLKNTEEQIKEKKKKITKTEEEIKEELNKHKEIKEEELPELYNKINQNPEYTDTLKKEVNTWEKKVQNMETLLRKEQEKLDKEFPEEKHKERSLVNKEIDVLKQQIKEKEKEKENITQTIGSLEEQHKTLRSNAEKSEKLSKQYKEALQESSYYARLMKLLFPGKKNAHDFKRYLTRKLLRDIVKIANEEYIKKHLSLPYEIRIQENKEGSLSLFIYDKSTGKERPVKTLSGGETFLISLALSLALSYYISKQFSQDPLGFIFIDEGFGTLDEERIVEAVSLLRNLSKEKIVGVISHHTKLKEWISQGIFVGKKENEGSFIEYFG